MSWSLLRWLKEPVEKEELIDKLSYNGVIALDEQNRQAILFKSQWNIDAFKEKHPKIELLDFLTH